MTGDATEVGVVDLGTCIQAVTTSSPEIIPGSGQDYAVYTSDHSELGTPLVGHGRLSQIHASSMGGPMSPSNQTTQLVTGLVRNSLGLFSSGPMVQDILEVQLRMVPVLSAQQSTLSASSNKYQCSTPNVPQHFEGQHVDEILRTMSPALVSMIQNASRTSLGRSPPTNPGTEELQRLLNGPIYQETRSFQRDSSGFNHNPFMSSMELSRQPSPAPSFASVGSQSSRHSLSRSRSRQAIHQQQPLGNGAQNVVTTDPGYYSDDRADEGLTRKRARLTQTTRPGKSSLGKKIDSLRVAASTAASVRMNQTTAIRAADNPVRTLEEPPRAPTPVPQNEGIHRRPPLRASKSNLTESYSVRTTDYQSPYSDAGNIVSLPNSAATSPETHVPNAAGFPEELGSSPPVVRDTSVFPSSPPLPPFQSQNDSGFMSADFDNLSGDEHDEKDHSPNATAARIAQQFIMPSECGNSLEPVKPPSSALPFPAISPLLEEEVRPGSSHLHARAAVGLKRSQTWSGEQPTFDGDPSLEPIQKKSKVEKEVGEDDGNDPAQDVGNGVTKESNEDTGKEAENDAAKGTVDARRKANKAWDKEKKKKSMQAKLANSVAAGVMPSFCDNCGAIETPTWRKAYSRIHAGSPDGVEIRKGDGAIIGIQILELNPDSSVKLFKIFKKSLLPADAGFSEFLLCNRMYVHRSEDTVLTLILACGLWLSNRNKMRPESLWHNDATRRKVEAKLERPKRPSRAKRSRTEGEPRSDNPNSQADLLTSDITHLQPNLYSEQAECPINDGDSRDPELPPLLKPRRDDANPQSKPTAPSAGTSGVVPQTQKVRESLVEDNLGSKETPINLDAVNADPVRRSLFSSPRSQGLHQSDMKEPNKPRKNEPFHLDKSQADGPVDANKEIVQMQPADENISRPKTPTTQAEPTLKLPPVTPTREVNGDGINKTPGDLSDLFKTPSNPSNQSSANKRITTSDFFSSAAKEFLHGPNVRTPSRIAPTTPTHSNLGTVPSLEEMTPFSRNLSNLLSEVFDPQNDPLNFLSDLPQNGYGVQGHRHVPQGSPTPSKRRRAPADKSGNSAAGAENLSPKSSPSKALSEYDDPMGEGLWEDIGFGSSPVKDSPSKVVQSEGT